MLFLTTDKNFLQFLPSSMEDKPASAQVNLKCLALCGGLVLRSHFSGQNREDCRKHETSLGYNGEFQVSLGYRVRFCLKNK